MAIKFRNWGEKMSSKLKCENAGKKTPFSNVLCKYLTWPFFLLNFGCKHVDKAILNISLCVQLDTLFTRSPFSSPQNQVVDKFVANYSLLSFSYLISNNCPKSQFIHHSNGIMREREWSAVGRESLEKLIWIAYEFESFVCIALFIIIIVVMLVCMRPY